MTITNARFTGADSGSGAAAAALPRRLPRLGPRMRLEVDVLQALGGQVRIHLRGSDVGVPQHLLQRAQVAAAGEQMRRERVAERVWAHPLGEARRGGVTLDDLVEPLARQPAAAVVDEQP